MGDVLSVASPATLHGTYGDLALAANGSYSYTLNNAALNVQSLRAGQQVSDVFAYSATDGLASATSNLVVTVTGTNDAPIAFADTASVKEDQTLSATGNVLTNDTDVDVGDSLKVLASATGLRHGTFGDLTLNADGSYSYALNNSATKVQALGRNATVTDTFTYTVTDDSSTPLQASSTLSVRISGTNDGPTAVADTASVSEDGSTVATGNVLSNDSDVDVGDTLSVASPATLHGTYGELALAANGSYSYTLNNAALTVQSLRAGQQVTDSFAYSATDGLASATNNLSVTVTGSNDAPIVAAALTDRKIDQNKTFTFTLPAGTFTDVDAGDSLSLSAKLASGAALPTWLSFDAIKQTFTGTAPSTVYGLLALAVTATDRSGATVTSSFALDISNVINGTAKADTLTGTNARDYIYGMSGNDTLLGGAGDDYLQADTGNDTLDGGNGSDILAGGNGEDVLRDLYGNNALLGGAQNDTIEAGAGNDFIAGGKHDDTISAGGGTNVIAYNEGDGRDTVLPGVGARNTLSLGGDIVASELAFHRKGLDLVMDVDSSDSMTFKDWYASAANKNFVTLQIMDQKIDKKDAGMPFTQPVETFDFLMLVNKFDAATAVNPKLSSWTLMNGLLDAHLASSTGGALGGELAARYAESAMLVMAPTAAQDVLRDAAFGTQAQSIGTRVNDSVQTFRMG